MKRVLLPVLMVVGLATVAWAQLTYRMEGNLVVRDQFSVTDDGPHGIGIAPESGSGLRIATKGQASGGLASAVRIDGTALAVSNGDILALLNVGSSGVIDVIGVNPTQASAVRLSGSTLTKSGAGTIPTAATLVIEDAPTIGTTNYAMWVKGGTVQLATLNATGTVKSSGQPGFLAYNSADDTGHISGTGIDVNTEVYDETGDFSADVFTAPITGRYLLCATATITNTSGFVGSVLLQIETSNRVYYIGRDPSVANNDLVVLSGCAHADMDASDAASVVSHHTAGTATVNGSSSAITFFSGRLMP